MTNRDPLKSDPTELTRLRKSIDRAFDAGRLSAEEHERQLAKIEQRLSQQRAQSVGGVSSARNAVRRDRFGSNGPSPWGIPIALDFKPLET
jgi:hypothetical protein